MEIEDNVFLSKLLGNAMDEAEREMQVAISKKFAKQAQVLIREGIVLQSEVEEFVREHEILDEVKIVNTRERPEKKKSLESSVPFTDPCARSTSTPRASC